MPIRVETSTGALVDRVSKARLETPRVGACGGNQRRPLQDARCRGPVLQNEDGAFLEFGAVLRPDTVGEIGEELEDSERIFGRRRACGTLGAGRSLGSCSTTIASKALLRACGRPPLLSPALQLLSQTVHRPSKLGSGSQNIGCPASPRLSLEPAPKSKTRSIWPLWGADDQVTLASLVDANCILNVQYLVCWPGISKRDDADINTAFD